MHSATLRAVEDYTNKYKGEQVELALFGGEYQEGTLTAYCSIEDVPHVELNGHILVPLQNIASLHCSSRCDAPQPDWPPRGLEELDRDERPDDDRHLDHNADRNGYLTLTRPLQPRRWRSHGQRHQTFAEV